MLGFMCCSIQVPGQLQLIISVLVRSPQSAGVIEITEKLGVKTETEGRKTIKYHEFSGALIHNFTFPEIPIEYEE